MGTPAHLEAGPRNDRRRPRQGGPEKTEPIPRGADLTDDDLRLIVDDFYTVRNWAALRMHLGPDGVKEHCFQALRARLGRRPLIIGDGS